MNRVKIFVSTDGTESNGYLFTDKEFKSVKFASQLMDMTFDINPTVIEQYAEIVIKDNDRTIRQLVVSEQLTVDMKVFVYVDDILAFTYLTSSWDIQASSTTVTLQCNDYSKRLENIQTPRTTIMTKTLAELFTMAFGYANFPYEYLHVDDETFATHIVVKDFAIAYQDVLTLLKKLCVVGMFRIYWNKDRFKIARCF